MMSRRRKGVRRLGSCEGVTDCDLDLREAAAGCIQTAEWTNTWTCCTYLHNWLLDGFKKVSKQTGPST